MIRMRFNVFGLWTLLLATCVHGVSAAPPTITSATSTNSVQVAEPFTAQWTVIAPNGATVTFPENIDKLGEFDVLATTDRFDMPQTDSPESRIWSRRVTLETVVTGDQQIPELEVIVRSNDTSSESSRVLTSKPIVVHVASVLEDRADPTQFRDIESVVDVDVPVAPSRAWVGWTLGGAGVLSALAMACVVIRRRRRTATPKSWAMNELDELESSLDSGNADIVDASQQLSHIVRSFLLLQLSLPASGDTPHEVVDEIESQGYLNNQVITRLRDLFTRADAAKFAGLQISRSEIQDAVESASEIVQTIATSTDNRRN